MVNAVHVVKYEVKALQMVVKDFGRVSGEKIKYRLTRRLLSLKKQLKCEWCQDCQKRAGCTSHDNWSVHYGKCNVGGDIREC